MRQAEEPYKHVVADTTPLSDFTSGEENSLPPDGLENGQAGTQNQDGNGEQSVAVTGDVALCSGYPAAFVEQLQQVVNHHLAVQEVCALIVLSIDNMPMIMSGYGQQASESVVESVFNIMRERLSDRDHLVRLQKDQIGMVVTNTCEKDARRLSQEIYEAVQGVWM